MIKKIIFILFLLCNIAYSSNAIVTPTDQSLITSDITTNDVSTSKHGFAPKAPNDATKYLDGTGAYSVPSGSGGTAAIFDHTVTGAAVTSVTTNGVITLDSNTDGGYIGIFEIINGAGTDTSLSLYFNNDQTAAHYESSKATSGFGVRAANAVFQLVANGCSYVSNANFTNIIGNGNNTAAAFFNTSCTAGGNFGFMEVSSVVTGAGHAGVSNLTRLDWVSSAANGIGIGSRFRLWKRVN
jgi:hypothetical protein